MDKEIILNELAYRTARSGGKGGQNVNKVETKVEALFHVDASEGLTPEEKDRIREKLAGQISAEGLLSAVNQTERSQLANKEKAREKLLVMLEKALIVPKKRKKVAIPASVLENRANEKKKLSEKKANRKKWIV